MLCQMRSRANSGQHQKLWRIDRRRGNNHLTPRRNSLIAARTGNLNPSCATLYKHNFSGQPAHKGAVLTFQSGLKIGIGRRPALALKDGVLHRAKAFLLMPVIIVSDRVSSLPPRFDKGGDQWVATFAAGDMQRAVFAPPVRVTAMTCIIPMLHTLEIRQNVRITPAICAHLGPCLIVARVTAHIDHSIDA